MDFELKGYIGYVPSAAVANVLVIDYPKTRTPGVSVQAETIKDSDLSLKLLRLKVSIAAVQGNP
jgi:hypothetical protein